MSVALVLSMGVVFAVVLALVLFFDRLRRPSAVRTRLDDYVNASGDDFSLAGEGRNQAQQRSVIARVLSFAAVSAPKAFRANVASDLGRARVTIDPSVFLALRVLLLVIAPGLGILLVIVSPQKGPVQWLTLAFLIFAALRLPPMWLQRRIKANEKSIQRALPYAIDLMVACLEGGLSLEGALDKVATETDGLLAEEIQHTLAEITLGRPSAEALRDLAARTGVADLRRLTETVLQADRMGVSIAEAMRTLADESRTRRRQRAEEEARKAPVKMVPVLVCTTLPAVGAVVLTPALINLGHALSAFARH